MPEVFAEQGTALSRKLGQSDTPPGPGWTLLSEFYGKGVPPELEYMAWEVTWICLESLEGHQTPTPG